MDLSDLSESIHFYEDRYSTGYMDEWDLAKKQRVKAIIQGLNLPDIGQALDFGCGTGVFTAIIKEALPHWEVYGTDISAEAIAKAGERHANCRFFVGYDERLKNNFDFIFTHHVLEHVYNINIVLEEINNYMQPLASCLHIVPCGNEVSFEYKLCRLVKNGIEEDYGGRFFFEDEGHIRRLTTQQLTSLLEPYRLKLDREYYANQYYGAIDWITTNREHISQLTQPAKAINTNALVILLLLRILLLSLYRLMQPANYVKKFKQRNNIGIKQTIFFSLSLVLYPFSILVYHYIKGKAAREWETRKSDRRGSEMYLYYKRFN